MMKKTTVSRSLNTERTGEPLNAAIYAAFLLGHGTSLARFLVLSCSSRQLLRTASIWPKLLPFKSFSIRDVQLILPSILCSPRQY